ncbi:MAG: glycosyltransferase family 39 protein [Patescibacteria group bacterium]|jgi:4-amino-4-deoxy-L-arabinose transferase-like glycosyltransferase
MKQKTIIFFVILVFAAIFVSIFSLGQRSLMDFDEATYARVVHESLINKNFLSFTLGGMPWFEKPPFYFWLAGGSAAILGENEFAMRLPSAAFLIGSIILIWFIVFELTKNKRSAFLSSAVLLSTAFFVCAGRQVRLDVPVTFAILFSFYSFIRGLKNPKWFLGLGAGLAAGVLLKSVIGLLLLPIIFIFSLIYGEWKWLKNKFFWASICLSFLLVLPWHLFQTIKFGNQFWDVYFFTHILGRVSENLVFGEVASRFHQLGQLFVVSQSWFLFFAFLGFGFILKYRSKIFQHRFEFFTLATALFVLIIFHVPRTILLYYFIPMFPFVAMFIGSFSEKLLEWRPRFFAVVVSLLFFLGFTSTFLTIFSNKDRNFFLQPLPKISRYMLSEEEREVGEKIKDSGVPFYSYKWNFFPTIIYYSDAKNILIANNGSEISSSFFLLVPRPLFKDTNSLPFKSVDSKLNWNLLYAGQAAMLFRAEVATQD